MKLKYIFPVLASVCVLTACGSKKESDKNVMTYDSAATTTVSVTSVTTTKLTTTSATTTTKKVDPPTDLILTGMDSVEVYSEINFDTFITDKNVDLKDGSIMLNTSETGVYEVDVPYLYNGGEFTKKLTYAVVDTTAPTIINSGWDLNHKVGTDFDLNN